MKTDLKAKYLQYLNQKKADQGFTLIELLVVIIIIGILSAIALPSFLNQANKAKQSEAKQYVGSMNRSQQAYYLEKGEFSTDISKLGLGIKTQTENYKYSAPQVNPFTATNAMVASRASALKPAIKGYIGAVSLGKVDATTTSESTTLAVLCEANNAGTADPDTPGYTATGPTCAGTTSEVK
ncbi:type IV pilin-like G/H family protein [Coleofasciculus sp. F4-SAH-05]|uniref:type IV pilin-like G/H family protein n=1 Tax=Coleofasciculus sp. F4-SAH-05 TaxID=3069525 RepID=UPI0032F1F494